MMRTEKQDTVDTPESHPSKDRYLPAWINKKILIPLLIIVIAAVFLSIFAWSEQAPQLANFAGEQGSRLADTEFVLADIENTPIPDEILENREQTNGIVLASIILVLIVVGGTLGVITQRENGN
jgi:hypothetical protein